MERAALLWATRGQRAMTEAKTKFRCAIYTRKSTDEGLEQNFNSLDAQRAACEAYILSQAGEYQYLATCPLSNPWVEIPKDKRSPARDRETTYV